MDQKKLLQIAELSREYIEIYDDVQSRDLSLRSDKDCLLDYLRAIEELDASSFELFLRRDYKRNISYRNATSALRTHGTSTSLHSSHLIPEFERMTADRQFELSVLRLIAGGLAVYCEPEWFSNDGIDEGVLEPVMPSIAVQKAVQKAIEQINKQGLELGITMHSLELIANGSLPVIENINPQLRSCSKGFQRLVREITILSGQLFDITSTGKNRFSTQAIQNILDLVEAPEVDYRTIQRYQEQYEGGCKALTDNIHDLPF